MARAVLALLVALLASSCRADESPRRPRARCVPAPVCPALPPRADGDTPPWQAIAERPGGPTADDLLEVELQVARAITPGLDPVAERARVAQMADAVRRTLPRRCDARCRVAALNRYLFTSRRFSAESDPDRLYDDVRNDLLPHVIARGRGYCVGLSHLYLALALRLRLDATIVPLRQHEFVRVTDERGAFVDVDPTRGGAPPGPARACTEAAPVFGRGLSRRALAGRTLALAGLAPGFTALGWLDAAVRLDDTDPDLYNNRAMARLRVDDAAGALDDLRRASALDPCTAVYAVNEADLLWSSGRDAEARARLDEVTARGGPSMVVEIRRAVMAYDEGRDADADATFTAALVRWVGAPSILQARAAVRLAQGRADDALRDVQAAVAVDDAAESYADVVLAALEAGRVSVASDALDVLVARSPARGSIDLHRALVAAAQGRLDVAEDAAHRCLARFGRRCVRAMLVLADVARARGDEGCARGYAEAYLSCPRAQGDRRQQRFDARTRRGTSRDPRGVSRARGVRSRRAPRAAASWRWSLADIPWTTPRARVRHGAVRGARHGEPLRHGGGGRVGQRRASPRRLGDTALPLNAARIPRVCVVDRRSVRACAADRLRSRGCPPTRRTLARCPRSLHRGSRPSSAARSPRRPRRRATVARCARPTTHPTTRGISTPR